VSQANFRIAAAGSTRIAFSAWRVPPSCKCGMDRAAPRRLRQPGAGARYRWLAIAAEEAARDEICRVILNPPIVAEGAEYSLD